MSTASQRQTWVGTVRSQGCQRYSMCEGQIHQAACPAFTVALPVAVRTAYPANMQQCFLLSSSFMFCMHFKVAALLKRSLQEPLCTHHRFPLLPGVTLMTLNITQLKTYRGCSQKGRIASVLYSLKHFSQF